MLYTVNILVSKTLPSQWDSPDGVIGVRCATPDIKPFGEMPPPEEILAAQTTRIVIGHIPEKLPSDDAECVYILCSELGLIYAAPGGGDRPTGADARKDDVLLSHRTWRQVGGLYLRVELENEAPGSWDAYLASTLSWWQRLKNRLLLRSCGKCLYFDLAGANEWRYQVTHAFGGVSGGTSVTMNDHMWDDITKIAAGAYKAPDIPKNELGYCPRRDCGLSGRLQVCREYKRKR
jgi:hypothetical protein